MSNNRVWVSSLGKVSEEYTSFWVIGYVRVKFGKQELLVNGNFTCLVNGNPILLQMYALDFIQTHVNLEFDTCIFSGVEKYTIFDRDYERYNAKLKY